MSEFISGIRQTIHKTGERIKALHRDILFSREDRRQVRELTEIFRMGNRIKAQTAAHNFARKEYGIPADVKLPSLPSWIDANYFSNPNETIGVKGECFIVFLPKKKDIQEEPRSRFLRKCFIPGDRSYWFCFWAHNNRITYGIELVDRYEGVPEDMQDLPYPPMPGENNWPWN